MEEELLKKYTGLTNEMKKPFGIVERIYITAMFIIITVGLLFVALNFHKMIGVFIFSIGLIMLIGYCILMNILQSKDEEKSIRHEKIVTMHEKLRSVLSDYGIDYTKDEEVNSLIELLRKRSAQYDFWRIVSFPYEKMISVAILPIVTYLLTKVAENSTIDEIISGAVLLITFIIATTLSLWACKTLLDDVLNRRKRQFERLIYELERIKVFKNCRFDDSKNKSK